MFTRLPECDGYMCNTIKAHEGKQIKHLPPDSATISPPPTP